jgi:hypothetical protein
MNSNEVVEITAYGRAGDTNLAMSDETRDVLSHLQWLDKQGISQTVEEIGYELKQPQIKSILKELADSKRIFVSSPKTLHVSKSGIPYSLTPTLTSYLPESVQANVKAWHEKAVKEGRNAAWVCLSCGNRNYSLKSDPRSVTCSKCKAHHTVTGRHTNGELFVQQFKVR